MMMKSLLTAVALAGLIAPPASAQTPPTRKVQKAQGRFSLDTPIAKLIADPRARAALTKTMPTLASSPHLKQFERMSIRELAANPHATISGAKIRALQAELAKIP